jgi:hypothetical protein
MNETTDRMKDDIRRHLIDHPQSARRLTYGERCAAFYALYWGYSRAVVSEAFGIHPTTASLIADCLVYDRSGRRRRAMVSKDDHGNAFGEEPPRIDPERFRRKSVYQDIAREFLELGEPAFGERYITEEARLRLIDAASNRKEGIKPRRTQR